MADALDKRVSGVKEGEMERSVSESQKAGKQVPKRKNDEPNAVNEEMARIDQELKEDKGKVDKGKADKGKP